jgi:hypothetical protein
VPDLVDDLEAGEPGDDRAISAQWLHFAAKVVVRWAGGGSPRADDWRVSLLRSSTIPVKYQQAYLVTSQRPAALS